MNGRVYCPEIGRFMSPDIAIQDATNLQALSAYVSDVFSDLSIFAPSRVLTAPCTAKHRQSLHLKRQPADCTGWKRLTSISIRTVLSAVSPKPQYSYFCMACPSERVRLRAA